jgi:hypothetical protein
MNAKTNSPHITKVHNKNKEPDRQKQKQFDIGKEKWE